MFFAKLASTQRGFATLSSSLMDSVVSMELLQCSRLRVPRHEPTMSAKRDGMGARARSRHGRYVHLEESGHAMQRVPCEGGCTANGPCLCMSPTGRKHRARLVDLSDRAKLERKLGADNSS